MRQLVNVMKPVYLHQRFMIWSAAIENKSRYSGIPESHLDCQTDKTNKDTYRWHLDFLARQFKQALFTLFPLFGSSREPPVGAVVPLANFLVVGTFVAPDPPSAEEKAALVSSSSGCGAASEFISCSSCCDNSVSGCVTASDGESTSMTSSCCCYIS
jgi:hypothetical protein